MQDLKIGILQLDQIWQDKQANFERIATFLKEGKELDILLLPEMFHTGFSMEVSLADDWKNSEGLHFLKDLARKYNTAIYTSIMIKDAPNFYNRGVFIEPSGKIATYDKRKAFGLGGEDKYFTVGQSETIVLYKDWRINLQICYDLRFAELIRNRIEENGAAAYDLLLYVANWPQKRILHWDTLLQARAIENQCYVAACNRVGKDGNLLEYNGHSQVFDMFGAKSLALPEQEGFFVVQLSGSALQDGRKLLPFLKDA
ncbi:MAG: nitrilase-related carbon-nitrogen hydrolase [Flavobacteriales bacterium]